jgi:allantoinase
VASLELSLPATWTGAAARGVSLDRLAQVLCAAPARLAGLASRKGTLEAGRDADIVVWDPGAEFTVDGRALAQRHKITPYDGMRLRGVIHRTYLRGQAVYRGRTGPSVTGHLGQILDGLHL